MSKNQLSTLFSDTYNLCLSLKVTNYTEQGPSLEANNISTGQKISHLLWNSNVHYHVHKSLPLVPILSQMNTIHTFPPYLKW
jgi:hypothetical protein